MMSNSAESFKSVDWDLLSVRRVLGPVIGIVGNKGVGAVVCMSKKFIVSSRRWVS